MTHQIDELKTEFECPKKVFFCLHFPNSICPAVLNQTVTHDQCLWDTMVHKSVLKKLTSNVLPKDEGPLFFGQKSSVLPAELRQNKQVHCCI